MSPRPVAAFRRGGTFWARVPRVGGTAVQRSLGVADESEAREIARFLAWLRGRGARSAYLLDRLADGKTPVLVAYRAYVENRLDAFEQELRSGIADPDIEPYVARWQKELARRKRPNAATAAKYLRQVRSLIADGQPFPRSAFTKQRIRAWLADLDVGQPNRYRAALSSFAEFLLLEDVIPANPVLHVPMAAEREPRTLHLSPDEAERLVDRIEPAYRALHALMVATGIEVSAALGLRRRDVEPDRIFARGTKRVHRQRTCTVYWRWSAFWTRHVAAHVADRGLLPDAKVFEGLTLGGAYRALKAGLKAATLSADYTTHDHRHTWAVQAVRDGLALHVVAHQLGHRDPVMTLRVYGRFVPTAADFVQHATTTATEATGEPSPRRLTGEA